LPSSNVTGSCPANDRPYDLAVRQIVEVVEVVADQLGRQVVARLVALVLDEGAHVPPVGEHLPGDVHLLVRRGLTPREREAVRAPVFQLLVVGLREPDEAEDHLAGQRVGERGDEVGG
jgi:hypothetical protein